MEKRVADEIIFKKMKIKFDFLRKIVYIYESKQFFGKKLLL
jgi:hypothetical protein